MRRLSSCGAFRPLLDPFLCAFDDAVVHVGKGTVGTG